MAAIDYFLKLDGISGESKDSKHKGEIDVLSFSFVETQSGSPGVGGGEDDAEPHDSFSLEFAKISYDYAPQKADGSLDALVHGGWDLTKNVKI